MARALIASMRGSERGEIFKAAHLQMAICIQMERPN